MPQTTSKRQYFNTRQWEWECWIYLLLRLKVELLLEFSEPPSESVSSGMERFSTSELRPTITQTDQITTYYHLSFTRLIDLSVAKVDGDCVVFKINLNNYATNTITTVGFTSPSLLWCWDSHFSFQFSSGELNLLLELNGLRPEFDRWNLVLGRPRLFIVFLSDWSTLIGRGPTLLSSHWSRASV